MRYQDYLGVKGTRCVSLHASARAVAARGGAPSVCHAVPPDGDGEQKKRESCFNSRRGGRAAGAHCCNATCARWMPALLGALAPSRALARATSTAIAMAALTPSPSLHTTSTAASGAAIAARSAAGITTSTKYRGASFPLDAETGARTKRSWDEISSITEK